MWHQKTNYAASLAKLYEFNLMLHKLWLLIKIHIITTIPARVHQSTVFSEFFWKDYLQEPKYRKMPEDNVIQIASSGFPASEWQTKGKAPKIKIFHDIFNSTRINTTKFPQINSWEIWDQKENQACFAEKISKVLHNDNVVRPCARVRTAPDIDHKRNGSFSLPSQDQIIRWEITKRAWKTKMSQNRVWNWHKTGSFSCRQWHDTHWVWRVIDRGRTIDRTLDRKGLVRDRYLLNCQERWQVDFLLARTTISLCCDNSCVLSGSVLDFVIGHGHDDLVLQVVCCCSHTVLKNGALSTAVALQQ